jgi:hypothetical protein
VTVRAQPPDPRRDVMHFDAVPFAARPAPETQVVTQLTNALRSQLTVAGVTNATGLADLLGVGVLDVGTLMDTPVWSWEEIAWVLNRMPDLETVTLQVEFSSRR